MVLTVISGIINNVLMPNMLGKRSCVGSILYADNPQVGIVVTGVLRLVSSGVELV